MFKHIKIYTNSYAEYNVKNYPIKNAEGDNNEG